MAMTGAPSHKVWCRIILKNEQYLKPPFDKREGRESSGLRIVAILAVLSLIISWELFRRNSPYPLFSKEGARMPPLNEEGRKTLAATNYYQVIPHTM